jgi:hypothetical protein
MNELRQAALTDLAVANGIRQGINSVHRGEEYEAQAKAHANRLTSEAIKVIKATRLPAKPKDTPTP